MFKKQLSCKTFYLICKLYSVSGRIDKRAESRWWNDLVHRSGRLWKPMQLRKVSVTGSLESRSWKNARSRDGLHLNRVITKGRMFWRTSIIVECYPRKWSFIWQLCLYLYCKYCYRSRIQLEHKFTAVFRQSSYFFF